MIVECYDIGGTKIRGAVIKSKAVRGGFGYEYEIIDCKTIASEKGSSQKLLEQIIGLSSSLKKEANVRAVDAISIGVPGPVSNGRILCAPPLQLNEPFDIAEGVNNYLYFENLYLEDGPRFSNVFVENDMNLAAKAELVYGIGKEKRNFYVLTLSTGIGVGIVIDGKVLTGACGEFGHDMLERNMALYNKCSCENFGCWVAMASGYGIEKSFEREFNEHKSAEEIFELANKDIRVEYLISQMKRYNAHGIGNMLNAFGVEAIVVTGSLGLKQFERIIPAKEKIKRYTVNPVPEIMPSKLGEEIGVLGAYAHAIECMNFQK